LHAQVIATLSRIDAAATDDSSAWRIKLAALRLSAADLTLLERNVAVAIQDYRDVICAAEYPRFFKIGFVGTDKLTHLERQQLIDADAKEYEDWFLNGP
jgi:hypothetical protein